MKLRNVVVLLMSVCFLSACSSSGALKVSQPFTQPITAGKSVAVSINTAANVEKDEDTAKVSRQLKEYLFTKLVTDGVFKSAVLTPDKGDYDLEVSISAVRVVSDAKRMLLGVMAGPSSIETAIMLKNSENGNVITAFNAEGSSAAHPMSSQVGYENAVREAADHIIKGLRQ